MQRRTSSQNKCGSKSDCDVSQSARPSFSASITFSNVDANNQSENDDDNLSEMVNILVGLDYSSSSGSSTPTMSNTSLTHKNSTQVIDDKLKDLSWDNYKAKEKLLRYRLHKEALQEYLSDDLAPRGLQIRIKPGLISSQKSLRKNGTQSYTTHLYS